ncbi:hypothetical protein P2H44_11640 [Albimonas sp. CAU 1670]|uniref:hypothetical protein n=1 Tax=Albimonas sp. CAU 1670 TaxID=3032599 RepID=UPI0023DC64D5|nr:hypothetical protein [Albimonas sp. CAU 1670]MDF2233205.1 hypothetical protein [Albimonas sp. CAU 1670]
MDQEIAKFILLAAKLEFFLVNHDHSFAHMDGATRAVRGINWDQIGQSLEEKHPFASFDFAGHGFQIFIETPPQYLTIREGGGLKWDSDEVRVSSWQTLLGRSYAQLRNNIAHGNKAQLPAPFTHDRTREFLEAGHQLINFVARAHSSNDAWSSPIHFR